MKRISINVSESYDILIENNILLNAKKYISEVYSKNRLFIISDCRVAKLYLDKLHQGLADYSYFDVVTEGYQKAKSLKSYEEVVKRLLALGIRRGDMLIALGGGVIGDLTGFIAGTLFRGLDFIQIPTSILAQNDSSIGGKTAINIEEGKNLIGVFKQPKLVLIDPLTIETLPQKEISSGMGEVIKHGLIGDRKLVEMLMEKAPYEEILYRSILVKKRVVEEDEFDTGKRMILNFGHTFGHAIEKEGNYSLYTHGEAVGLGMLMALRLGEYYGFTNNELYPLVKKIMTSYQMDTKDYSIKKYLPKIIYDKKNISGVIHFIILDDIEKTRVFDIKEADLIKMAGDFHENISE